MDYTNTHDKKNMEFEAFIKLITEEEFTEEEIETMKKELERNIIEKNMLYVTLPKGK